MKKKKAWVHQNLCVGCGCCVKICPLSAIHIFKGIYSQIDTAKCVGCGKCAQACPASVIEIIELSNLEVIQNETKEKMA